MPAVRAPVVSTTMVFLGLAGAISGLLGASPAHAAKPMFAARCSNPTGQMASYGNGEVTMRPDRIRDQRYTLLFYEPNRDGVANSVIVIEGVNNLNEQGTYRVYGDQDNPIIETQIIYDEATWVYSLFARSKVLFIHSTKAGILGDPTAHLLIAQCE